MTLCWSRRSCSRRKKVVTSLSTSRSQTSRAQKLQNHFPRTTTLPSQSSKFWAKEKDRYLRQLLISDIEQHTGRELVVYFARLDEGINNSDPDDLSEIVEGIAGPEIDLVLQTPGGIVDAVEKFVTVLKQRGKKYRVIVPSVAKSGGTVIAMASEKILLGVNSELGPIDPQFMMPNLGPVPCEFIAADPSQPPTLRAVANSTVIRMRQLAKKILSEGMMKGKSDADLDTVIQQITSSGTYNSHGAVIDFSEAEKIGLSVEWMEPDSELWRRIWLLYCCYDHDIRVMSAGKILEGASNSMARPPSY